jgi:hypothetical protein
MSKNCLKCGFRLDDDSNFCISCGVHYDEPSQTIDKNLSWTGLLWALTIPLVCYFLPIYMALTFIYYLIPNSLTQFLGVTGMIFSILNLTSTFRSYFYKSPPLPLTKSTTPITIRLFEKFGLFQAYKFSISSIKSSTNSKFEFKKPTIINISAIILLIATYGFINNSNNEIKYNKDSVAINFCAQVGVQGSTHVSYIMDGGGYHNRAADYYISNWAFDSAWPERMSMSQSEFSRRIILFFNSMKKISPDDARKMELSGELMEICKSYFKK